MKKPVALISLFVSLQASSPHVKFSVISYYIILYYINVCVHGRENEEKR